MKTYKFIPYQKKLVSRARELRKNTTETEKIFWDKIVSNKKLLGLKFTRQKPLGHFIVDFYCASLSLAVEVDGEVHDIQRDKERDNILKQKFGIMVIRYKNEEVLKDIERIREDLMGRIGNTTP